ncbi:MAG: DUF2911 domain-containing protein [Sphingobacteriales bacterium]|nr:DUF2911 domain-containing protein [Sphingobacteriales bacterium]
MKKLLLLLSVFTAFGCEAQDATRKSPHDTVSNANTKVTYGRPYKKGRDVFGTLEKFGVVWRVGADEATTISFAHDLKFGGADVKAGTYTLFAIPGETEWTIILNSQLGQWGAFSYGKYKDKDVASVKVPVQKTGGVVEQLTIRFLESGFMVIEWDMTRVIVPIVY